MQLTLANRSAHFIRSYDAQGVQIADRHIGHSVLIAATQIIDWPVTDIAQLSQEHLQPVFELKPEVVILTTGFKQAFTSAKVRAAFMAREIGLECMELGAACRTFNVLLSEDRVAVLALLLPAADSAA